MNFESQDSRNLTLYELSAICFQMIKVAPRRLSLNEKAIALFGPGVARGGNDGKVSSKETGPMVKVLAWSHFRKTVIWIDDFETTCEELIAKLAVNLQVHPEDIRIEDGAGSYVADVNLQYPLWKLRKGNALGVSTSFFGFTEFSLYISVFDEFSSPLLKKER